MITELKNKVNQLNAFIDEAFDVKQTSSFQLIFQVGIDGLLLTVRDVAKNKYVALESYSFHQIYNVDVIADLVDVVKKDSKLISNKYLSVKCVLANNISTLVPNPLFEEDKRKTYLQFNALLTEEDDVLVDEIKNLNAKNVFAIPKSLKTKLDDSFKNVHYHHISSALIDSLLIENKNTNTKRLFIHVQANYFNALLIEGKNLLFHNSFNYHSPEDFIYYLLFACEQLHLNPETIEVVILGEIEKDSAIYILTQKYIRNLKFGKRADEADYSYQLQTLPKHFYYTLFNNYFA